MKPKLTLVFLICIVCFTSCSDKQDMNDPSFKTKIEQLIGLKFPASVKWINCQFDCAVGECGFVAAFKIPKKDLSSLFPDEKFSWSSTDRHFVTNNLVSLSWFDPDSIKDFRATEQNYPNPNSVLEVLYDSSVTDDAEPVIVYMNWFEVN